MLDGRYTWIEEDVPDPSGDGPMIAGQPEKATGDGVKEEAAQTAELTPEPAAT